MPPTLRASRPKDGEDEGIKALVEAEARICNETLGQKVGSEVEVADDIGDCLPAVIVDLHQRADRHG